MRKVKIEDTCEHEWMHLWDNYYSSVSECKKCGKTHVREYFK